MRRDLERRLRQIEQNLTARERQIEQNLTAWEIKEVKFSDIQHLKHAAEAESRQPPTALRFISRSVSIARISAAAAGTPWKRMPA